ncbi:MAG TPA: spermidine/putrescine ABC transporter ATP-binding protein [Lachnospiraceae bacterium]|nr:spermidine/putrescine ABC transporter ATP-binding protein [Lachnospiraceae bacterium]
MEPIIQIKNVSKTFESKSGQVKALQNISIDIEKGDIFGMIGMSGAGKSTLVRCINFLERPTEGTVIIDGKDLGNISNKELRKTRMEIAMIFQHFNLLMQRTVIDNVCFPLEIAGVKKKEAKERARELLKIVGLENKENAYPESLSGGQQQRVAIARAIVNEPKVLLLDEPLGALDLKLRKEMQIELKRIQKQLGITFVFVTHDQEEALTMSDTVVVMNKGVIQQMGTPEDIYNEPENKFVARFIGESNITDGIMLEDFKVKFCGRIFECVDKGFDKDEYIDVVIRPEDIKIVNKEEGNLKGIVKSSVFKGVHYELEVEEESMNFILHNTKNFSIGTEIGMDIYPEDIHIMKKSGDA